MISGQFFILLLAEDVSGRWQLGIGDPSFMGWFTTVSYFAAACFCLACTRRYTGRQSMFWLVIAAILVLLGINKQLDLQTLLTEIGRDLAKSQGWYEQRRIVQKWFIGVIAVGGIASLGLFAWFFKQSMLRNTLALLGLTFLVCFVVIRAASFHRVDALLGWRLNNVPMNSILELGGISIIMVAAIKNLLDGSKGTTPIDQ